jgi:hypothetical protein
VTKLPPDAEQVIRQLDEIDETEDVVVAAEREPYRSRLLARLSALRSPELEAFRALRRLGLLEFFAPRTRKRGERHHKPNMLDYAVNDVRRLKKTFHSDGKVTAELIAAERYRRFMQDAEGGPRCTVDKFGDLEEGEAELRDIEKKLHARLHGSGTTGGARHRSATRRAK